jgi:hypothetical protein
MKNKCFFLGFVIAKFEMKELNKSPDLRIKFQIHRKQYKTMLKSFYLNVLFRARLG